MTTTTMIRPQEPEPISISAHHRPTWKLYENPFYTNPHNLNNNNNNHSAPVIKRHENNQVLHRLHLPVSARKIAASFWDLTFVKSSYMVSELEAARAQILELKAELEFERKSRKKVESMNKKLARELSEERKHKDAMRKMFDRLAAEASSEKAQIKRVKKEMEEERKMLRVAEVLREERVQMKLSEAKFLFEEKMMELEKSTENLHLEKPKSPDNVIPTTTVSCSSNQSRAVATNNPRKASPEAENPHIKRGIKGFVEFPKVVKAIGSKSRQLSTKLECQKAQLRLLLKQKNPVRSNIGLLTS
ncbi:PREDICTED: protein BRANCHLESS TRICHOME-like [Ipomoea nil]|uniref:protein BRANCHLESS TRICHOME-like n=1 Tax=Ipomoea nil TaxID=35883 RepID=UPI000901E999|nr:PREDICTED: protein BRANCHLESS TRICHOME-like [Ipomoea nil]